VKFPDIDNFYHEWVLDDLPWDAVSQVHMSNQESLQQPLLDAITERALNDVSSSNAKNAALAFLYMYMILAHGNERYVNVV
jgi:hypothetical protein